jgi:hypothetical protein
MVNSDKPLILRWQSKMAKDSKIPFSDTNQLLYQLSYAGIYLAKHGFLRLPDLHFSRSCSTVAL